MQQHAGAGESAHLTTEFLARRYGVSVRTLRFFEEMDLLKPMCIGGVRLFSARDTVRLELILTGKRLGFSLQEIDGIIRSHIAQSQIGQSHIDNAEAESTAAPDIETIQGQLSLLESQKAELEAAILELKTTLTRQAPAAGGE